VNARKTRNGKLDGFERCVSHMRLLRASFFHDAVYQVCQVDSTAYFYGKELRKHYIYERIIQ